MERAEQKFLRYIDEHDLIRSGEKILVGFSGGPDSVFLLHLLHKFSKRLKIKVYAVHIHHGLRGKDADEDEKFCGEFCRIRKIDFTSVRKNVKTFSRKNKYSLEEAGRILRYREYNKVIRQKKLDKTATAHNANDNTETVLLNIIKGTGLDGISGIPVKRENIIRPILCFTKDEILSYLKKNKLSFRIDKSNLETGFERNYLRNRILPLIKERINPSIDNAVLVSSENLRSVRDYILINEKETFNDIRKDPSGNLLIGIEDLKKAKVKLKGLLLKGLLERELEIPVFSKDINKVFSLIDAQTGKKIELSGGIIVFRERDFLKIFHRPADDNLYPLKIRIGEQKKILGGKLSVKESDKESIVYSKNKNKEYISADTIGNEFTVRRWKQGDTFHPLGMSGSKKISDFLNEQKVESSGKKDHLILLNDNKVVWVIGLRIDDRFKITSSTQRILELCLN